MLRLRAGLEEDEEEESLLPLPLLLPELSAVGKG
jgi:hypothetical protein